MVKSRKFIYLFSIIIVLAISIGYAALGSEMSLSNLVAEVRIKEDIRITDVSVYSTEGSPNYNYVKYDKDSIISYFSMNAGDSITFKVEITNIENAEMGILNLSGLPDGISYSFGDSYTEKEKLCNGAGLCNLGMVKEIYLTISSDSTSISGNEYIIDFSFQPFYTISYDSSITNNGYPTEIIGGGDLVIMFTNPFPSSVSVFSNGLEVDSSLFTYENNVLTYNNVSGHVVIKDSKTLYSIMQMTTNGLDTNIDFSKASSATNGDGVNTVSGTENDKNPIYYYRGNVENNNVLFAGFCWKMVRTTELGGVKLIYNGKQKNIYDSSEPLSQNEYINVVNNSSTPYVFDSSELKWSFEGENTAVLSFSVENSGDYEINYNIYSSFSDESVYFYIDDQLYFDRVYTNEAGTFSIDNLSSDSVVKVVCSPYDGRAQFSFNLSQTTGNTIKSCGNNDYFGHLPGLSTFNSGGNSLDNMRYINVNGTDSDIKAEIDRWYEKNIINYGSYLEDASWCNDRSISTTSSTSSAAYDRILNYSPSLKCSEEYQLSMGATDTYRHMKYPIALLTSDEFLFAGSNRATNFLSLNDPYWSMTPASNYMVLVEQEGYIASTMAYGPDAYAYTRPSIVLKNGISVLDGTGVSTNPYTLDIPNMISFAIGGTIYYAEEGMTWGEFIDSNYNIDDIFKYSTYYSNYVVYNYPGVSSEINAAVRERYGVNKSYTTNQWVVFDDQIINGKTYYQGWDD